MITTSADAEVSTKLICKLCRQLVAIQSRHQVGASRRAPPSCCRSTIACSSSGSVAALVMLTIAYLLALLTLVGLDIVRTRVSTRSGLGLDDQPAGRAPPRWSSLRLRTIAVPRNGAACSGSRFLLAGTYRSWHRRSAWISASSPSPAWTKKMILAWMASRKCRNAGKGSLKH